MNYTNDSFMKQRPMQDIQYTKEREESVVHKTANDQFGSLMQGDYSSVNFDTEQQFKFNPPGMKKDARPYVGSLPYRTTPRSWEHKGIQMIPETTRVSKVCFNDAVENSGPWYLRHWQIWDNAPFLPSMGDVSKDPRYGMQTKGFTTEYKRML